MLGSSYLHVNSPQLGIIAKHLTERKVQFECDIFVAAAVVASLTHYLRCDDNARIQQQILNSLYLPQRFFLQSSCNILCQNCTTRWNTRKIVTIAQTHILKRCFPWRYRRNCQSSLLESHSNDDRNAEKNVN